MDMPKTTTNKTISKIILILRWLGGGAIVLSSIQFMLAGKLDLNSMQTHYLFLSLTCGLTILGIITAKKLKDLTTARIFLGLSLALIPPQIAQIGGFIIAKLDGVATNLPKVFITHLPSDVNIVLVFISSILLLSPVIYLAFKVLFRKNVTQASLLYMTLSLLILLPTRNLYVMSVLVITELALVIILGNKAPKAQTNEAKFSKLIQYWPIIIIIGRTLLYPASTTYYALVAIIFASAAFVSAPKLIKNETVIISLQSIAGLVIIPNLFILCSEWNVPIVIHFMVLTTVLILMSFKSIIFNTQIRVLASVVLCPAYILAYNNHSSSVYQLLILILPVVLIYTATIKREATSFTIVSIATLVYLFSYVSFAFQFINLGLWQGFAIAGIIILLLTSLFDRYQEKLKYPLINFYRSFKIQE
jgi:hypothetical protein